jgi:transcriptional regulator with XRE-family HTH domain
MALTAPPHPARCAALLRRQGAENAQPVAQVAESVHRHCGHSRLRAQRLARGWTLAALITQVQEVMGEGTRLTPSRVSRWELEEDSPSAPYRDALCRVYRVGPVELGLCADIRENAARSVRLPFLPAPLPTGAHLGPLIDAVSAVRRRMDQTLSGTVVSDGTVAYWEEVSDQYGRTYKTRAAVPFLTDILADFAEVQVLTDKRLPSGPRRDLCRVAAKLAGLISMTMTNVGDYREARGWGHTARLAADESGDPVLQAWVITRGEAIAHLYFGDPHAAMTAARHAQLVVRNTTCGSSVMAPALEARAAAALGDAETVREALRRAGEAFGRLGKQENIAYTFTEAQLQFYASNALTLIGDTKSAVKAQDAALGSFPSGERLEPTLVHLDRAACLLEQGDIVGGVEHATSVLTGLSEEFRPPIVVQRARALGSAIPPQRRGIPAVRHFRDVLAIGS